MNKKEKKYLEIRNNFAHNQSFSRQKLFDFLNYLYPDLKETTFRWHIYDLKKNNVISSVKRGVFKLTTKYNFYNPYIDKTLPKIYHSINKKYPDVSVCVWNSNWVNEFSRHQAFRNTVLVEVEKDLVDIVFYHLSDKNFKNVFLEPNNERFKTNISETDRPIIVRSLLTKAPIQKVDKISIPKIEKILVDLFCDKNILAFYQGYELITIFETALSKYEINFTTLLYYSRRREREKQLKEFLLTNFEKLKEIL